MLAISILILAIGILLFALSFCLSYYMFKIGYNEGAKDCVKHFKVSDRVTIHKDLFDTVILN